MTTASLGRASVYQTRCWREFTRPYDRMAPSDSNWSFFYVNDLAHSGKFPLRKMHRRARRAYDKSIYGSSESLPAVLRECLSQGSKQEVKVCSAR